MKFLKLALILAAAAGSAFSISCSTTKGFGQDLQKLGSKMENEADASGGATPVQPSSTGIYTPPASTATPAAY